MSVEAKKEKKRRRRQGGSGESRNVATVGALEIELDAAGAFGPESLSPGRREEIRRLVEAGLPVDVVGQLQTELSRWGIPRPSSYVESIASRASRARRSRLTPEEGEKLVRVASTLVRSLAVWEDEEAAAAFLTAPHPELGGDRPIDRTLSEIGARQVEEILVRLDLGLPV